MFASSVRKSARLSLFTTVMAFIIVIMLTGSTVRAQCPPNTYADNLLAPSKIILSRQRSLIVAEAGAPGGMNTGRITIFDRKSGARRTLIDNLPSGLAPPEGEPSGPSGLAVSGRFLFVTIGNGDSTLPGPFPGTEVLNPNPSSPLFNSVLRIQFSARVENTTGGFTLTPADQLALKNGETVIKDNGGGDQITIELVADFPALRPNPIPPLPSNVRASNPYGVVIDGGHLYVADAGFDLIWKVDINRKVNFATGAFEPLVEFPRLTNPLAPFGPPLIDSVPDSIRRYGDKLLVTFLTGFPFPPGLAQVIIVDPATGTYEPFITGLTMAIDVLPVKLPKGDEEFLTLEFGAGQLRRFAAPGGMGELIADCLVTPTSMVLDPETDILYITEIFTGRIVQIQL